jgi:hypothetical protein
VVLLIHSFIHDGDGDGGGVVMMDGDGGGGGYDEDGRPDVSGRRGKNDGICTIIWGGGWGAWHVSSSQIVFH